jgi:ubiquitin-protein ligase
MEQMIDYPDERFSLIVTRYNPRKWLIMMPGPIGTPYEEGVFTINVELPEYYPMAPPIYYFITPIIHPNIDDKGRICLDIL